MKIKTPRFYALRISLNFIRFVEKEIDPIIKTLQSYIMSRKTLRSKIDRGNLISDLDKEVKVWADNQSEEIKLKSGISPIPFIFH